MSTVVSDGFGAQSARMALYLTVVAAVLALHIYTPSPSNDIKYFLLAWAAPILAGWALWLRRDTIAPGPVLALWCVFALWMTFTGLVSAHTANGLFNGSRFLSLALLSLAASQLIQTPALVKTLCRVIVGAVFAASSYALIQYLGLDPLPWDTASMADEAYTGLPATFGNANLAAHVLALALVLAVYLMIDGTGWLGRALCLAAAAAFTAHLLYTGQRAAPLALVVAAAFTGVTWLFARRGASSTTAFRLLLGALAVAGLGFAAVFAILFLRTQWMPLDASLLLRYNSFLGAAEMIADKPILGFGCGNYVIENTAYWTRYEQHWFADRYLLNHHTHNEWLETGACGGLPGLMLLIALSGALLLGCMVYAFQNAGSQRRLGLALLAFFVTFIVDGFFGFNLRSPASAALFAVMLGAAGSVLFAGTRERMPLPVTGRWLVGAVATVCAVLVVIMGTLAFRGALLMKSGETALAAGRVEEAAELLGAATAVMPWSWDAPQLEGRALSGLGRRSDAIAAYETALSRNPNDIASLLAAGQVSFALYGAERGDAGAPQFLQDSKNYVARAEALCPMLAAIDGMKGRYALANAQDLQAQGAPDETVHAAYEEARTFFETALPFAGDDRGNMLLFLFQAAGGMGDHDAALAAIQRAVRAAPEKSEAWNLYYAFARTAQHLDAFRADVDRAAAAHPDGKGVPLPLAVLGLARSEGAAQWPDASRMLGVYADTVEEQERSPAEVQTLAWAADELAVLVEGADDDAMRSAVFLNLAGVYSAMGLNDLAAGFAERAYPGLEGAERSAAAHFLAQMHLERKDFGNAQKLVEEALRLNPRDINVWMTSARILAAAGQRGPAIQRYQQILRQFRDLPAASRNEIERMMTDLQNPA